MAPEILRQAVGASAGLGFVPLFEGFGIPLLEAMRCEIPIIASNVTSLPEVAGKAAIYADPEDTGKISEAMLQLATDDKLRGRLIIEGRKQVAGFSWDKTALKFWESVCKLSDEC
jgi:glycosyltransferase involved in cell wall biosynthesis